MRKESILLIAVALVILNILLGHFFAPYGIITIPIVVIAVTLLLTRIGVNTVIKSLLIFGLIAVHDIGVKLYSGGYHDRTGLAWVQLLFLIGVLPSFVILIAAILQDKKEATVKKVIAIMIFPVLIACHMIVFRDLGMGRFYWYN